MSSPLDPLAVAALAHPLRSRLLELLRTDGPATATSLAAALGTNSGATSYHLRRLAAVGLIDDAESGHGRRRVWAAVDAARPWSRVEPLPDADTRAALAWLERDHLRHFAGRMERWLDSAPAWPTAWRDACSAQDGAVLVDPEHVVALRAEIAQVLARYRRVGQGNPGARRLAAYVFYLPVDLDRPPHRAEGTESS